VSSIPSDFSGSDGKPGYFANQLLVYDRAGGDFFQYGEPIRQKVIRPLSSYFLRKMPNLT
jgi:formamidopyrimidine-DNA glycosylase